MSDPKALPSQGSASAISPPTKQSLSRDQQRLIEVFQRVRYGRIQRLQIRNGQPVLGPDLRWIRMVKVLGANDPHPLVKAADFLLRQEAVSFFQLLESIGDGEIQNLEVRNGLPFTFEVEENFPR